MAVKEAFKGFDVVLTAVRMSWQMLFRLFVACAVFQIIMIIGILYFYGGKLYGDFDKTDICLVQNYWTMKAIDGFKNSAEDAEIKYTCEGGAEIIYKSQFYNTFGGYVEKRTKTFLDALKKVAKYTALIYLLIPALCVYFGWKHRRDSKDKHLRGAVLVSGKELGRLIQEKAKGKQKFYVSEDISIPIDIITRHTLVLGKPGSGKTQLISRIIAQIMERDYRGLIHDFKGDMISTFYDHRKHLIFNPLDKRHMGLKDREQDLILELKAMKIGDLHSNFHRNRKMLSLVSDSDGSKCIADVIEYSVLLDEIINIVPYIATPKFKKIADEIMQKKYPVNGWTIFNELRTIVDIEAFCASLVPESASQDNFWPISCRQLLGATISYCVYHGKTTHSELWEMVNKSNEELLEMFKTTPGCEEGVKLLTEAKTANNILAVLSNYTKSFKYLLGTEGEFSIKSWVGANDHPKRVIFLSNMAMIQETMKPFLTLFVDFATKSLCSLGDDLNRRLHFVLDEFGQLGKIGSIIQLLTQSRSKGGATYLLIQDVSQITSTYGGEGCNSIVNSCGNLISFAVKDKEAEFVSKSFGTKEIKRTEESKSIGVEDMKDSFSISQQTVEKQIVLASEVTNLPTLNYYIHLTDYPVAKDKLDIISFPTVTAASIQREDLQLKTKNGSAAAGVELEKTLQNLEEQPQQGGLEGEDLDELYGDEGTSEGDVDEELELQRSIFGGLKGYEEGETLTGEKLEAARAEAMAVVEQVRAEQKKREFVFEDDEDTDDNLGEEDEEYNEDIEDNNVSFQIK